uniref:Uncharacterized protein n=1 Tax=Leptobrachium leishanense TaxID=445787 RepID=A0A8C5R751_9ANUR
MSGPVYSVPNGCSSNPVTCISTWRCDPELFSVLNVWYSECARPEEKEITRICSDYVFPGLIINPWVTGYSTIWVDNKRETIAQECCVRLEPVQTLEASNPCSLFFSCIKQVNTRIVSLGICSQARTIEVYSLSHDGQEEEYLGTSRGEKFCTFVNAEDDGPVTMYSTHLRLDFPVASCKVKLLSLGGKQHVFLSEMSVQVALVPEKSTLPPSVLGSSINLDRVQNIMDSMGGKMSPGAEQLMNMVRAQQKHQIPFGAHLLQLFGGADHGVKKVQKREEEELKISPATNGPDLTHESPHHQEEYQPPVEPRTTSLCSVPPSSDNLSLEKKQCLPGPAASRETNQDTMEKDLGAVLERLISVQIERMETNLMQHIDQKMKILQEHLDARLDQFIHALQNSNNTSSGRVGEKQVNGESDHRGEHNGDCIMLSKHYMADTSALS